MKLLVYGRDSFMTGLTSKLPAYGIEILDIRQIKDIPASLEQCKKPDLALIEKKAEDTVNIVKFIHALWGIPIVLQIGTGKKEWRGLEKLNVDGFVTDTFSNGELFARLSAIQRRVTAGKKDT
jgi:hypothetical protein